MTAAKNPNGKASQSQRKIQMAKAQQSSLTWTEVNPDTLQPNVKEGYENVRHSYAKTKAAREKFEKLFAKATELPSTHRWLFSYKFDRLSVAIDVAKSKNVGPRAIDFNTLKAGLRDETNDD